MSAFPYSNVERPFSLMSQEPAVKLEDRLAGVQRSLNQPRTPLFEAFFAVENMDILQNRLRATIMKQTGYTIDRQSDDHLTTIMRKVYAEQATHRAATPQHVATEVRRLDDIVLGVVVPMVATGVASYLLYLRDASRIPDPLPRGVQTSIKGTKSYELFRGL